MPRSFVALAIVALAACTGDVCSQEQALLQQSSQIALRCVNQELQDAGLPPYDGGLITCTLNVTACESGLKSCTAADIQLVQTQVNCENEMLSQESATCAVPTGPTCGVDGGTLSQACAQALSSVQVVCDGGLP